MEALRELADSAEKLFRVGSRFTCPKPVKVENHNVATHLFRIAQESVGNAIKHSRASQIEITLADSNDRLVLTVRDNGIGLPSGPTGSGMGLRIMQYRAGVISGDLTCGREPSGGTTVVCSVPKNVCATPPAE
jgi:two-component system CheB/CheR fusion protein